MNQHSAGLRKFGEHTLSWIENAGLLLILIITVFAGGQAAWDILEAGRIDLADLLLLFIYLELVTMVRMYFTARSLPVRMPLYIAMVAISRHIVVDTNHNEYQGILLISVAVLVLAIAVIVVRYGHLKLPYDGDSVKGEAATNRPVQQD